MYFYITKRKDVPESKFQPNEIREKWGFECMSDLIKTETRVLDSPTIISDRSNYSLFRH